MFRQRPHNNGGKHAQYWCVIIGSQTLHVMGSIQDRLRYSTLVTIWVSLPALPPGVLLGQIWVSPRCGTLFEKFGTPIQKNSAAASQSVVPLVHCLEVKVPQHCTHSLWSISWSYTQKLRFVGKIPPCSCYYVFRRFGLTPWAGSLRTFHFPTCRWIPCPHG